MNRFLSLHLRNQDNDSKLIYSFTSFIYIELIHLVFILFIEIRMLAQ